MLLVEQFSECRGPLQTYRSSRRHKHEDTDGIGGGVKRVFEGCDIRGIQSHEWSLALRSCAAAVKIEEECPNQYGQSKNNHFFSAHFYLARRSATKFAITCGNRVKISTIAAENHNRTLLRIPCSLPHFFACQAW